MHNIKRLRALRQHCITHRHDSVINNNKWGILPGILPETTVGKHICRAICRCQLKLYHAKRTPYVNMVQKRRRVLWAKAHLKWTVSKRKSVLWSDESKFHILVGDHGRCALLKGVRPFMKERVISIQFKSQHLWWYGVHKCIRMGRFRSIMPIQSEGFWAKWILKAASKRQK